MQAGLDSGDTSHSHVFISHCTHDDEFVAQLRRHLQSLGIPVWTDSERLRGGNQLAPEIDAAIADARQVIAVLSPHTVNSPWVRREIEKALEVERERKAQGYRVAALLLPGMKPTALASWFDEEPVAITISAGNGGLTNALPDILAALGERAPHARQTAQSPAPQALAELVLKLQDPQINAEGGKRRVAATATLEYQPPQVGARSVVSKRFAFEAPLGPIEADDLRWYLERYHLWPVGVFRERAERIEQQLPRWGQELYRSALDVVAAQPARVAWQSVAATSARRFSVEVDTELLEGASDDTRNRALEAGTGLLALPWELLRDERGWLFQGAQAVRVRRRLPSRHPEPARSIGLPIRILLVSPRPEDDATGYIDHRISARPLVMALESLGELAELTVLPTPTQAGLEAALLRATRRGQPFDVVHFDGHGVYDPKLGLEIGRAHV